MSLPKTNLENRISDLHRTGMRHSDMRSSAAQLTDHCDVLIIGAGLAGLTTALSLPNDLHVIVLAKEDLQACSSQYAQGGIAAVIDQEDKVADHVSDTLIAGDGLCDVQATTHILSQGKQAINWLLERDVPFTTQDADHETERVAGDITDHKTDASKLKLSDLHLTQEGGHGRRRVAHAEDATGRHIMTSLHQKLALATNITVLPFHEALSLITEGDNNPVCTGAQVLDAQNNCLKQIKSKAVVLASGGLGQLFSRATAPNVCVGDGIMMAWEAGCRLANLEFIQFHPTGLVYDDERGDRNFLISEAVRGEGGLLINPLTGKRFMPDYDERVELAPRDIVARAIANEIALNVNTIAHVNDKYNTSAEDNANSSCISGELNEPNKLGYVHLDISHKPAEFIREHFPDIYAHCLSLGIDITTDPIPVAPTAHYTCGGVLATATGLTDVKGLYAAGEVANTGLHGANRLASNSLLECVVVGQQVANHIPSYLADLSHWEAPPQVSHSGAQFAVAIKPHVESTHLESTHLESTKASDKAASKLLRNMTNTTNSTEHHWDSATHIAALKQLMTTNMGIRRHESSLQKALEQIYLWQQQCHSHLTQADRAQSDGNFNLDYYRFNRLLTLASLLLQSALTREESRGGHYRNDFPTPTTSPASSIIYPLSVYPLSDNLKNPAPVISTDTDNVNGADTGTDTGADIGADINTLANLDNRQKTLETVILEAQAS